VTLSPNQIVVTAMVSGNSSLVILERQGKAQSMLCPPTWMLRGLRSANVRGRCTAMRSNIEESGDRVTLSAKWAATR